MAPNCLVVWFVVVNVRAGMSFCKVSVYRKELSYHDKIVKMASKKQGTSASARSPIDFVSAAGLVMVPKFK
jgi:hypothetical protein